MKKTTTTVFACLCLSLAARAAVPLATYRWNFNQTNVNSTNYVFPTISDGTVPETPLSQQGILRSLDGGGASVNLLGLDGSGVSSGLFTNIPHDRALSQPGTYNVNSYITRTPSDAYALTNLGLITNFTITCWAKSDLAGGFVDGQFPRILMFGANGQDAGSAGLNAFGLLFFNSGNLQLKVHNVSNPNSGNGMSTSTLPLAGAATNWVFIAVTYDGTVDTGGAPATGTNVVFYVGNRSDSFYSNSPLVSVIYTNYYSISANSVYPGAVNSPGFINFNPALTNGDGSTFGISNVYVAIGNRYNGTGVNNGGGNRAFNGRYDDVRLFANRVLTVDEIEAVRTNAPPGSGGPLKITQQPASQVRAEGQAIQFTVATTEAPNRGFQWYRLAPGGSLANLFQSANAIPGANSSIYTTPALTVAADNGANYGVRITSTDPLSGSINSSNASVVVVAPANTVSEPGMLTFQYYSGISGQTVADLQAASNYPNAPDSVLYLPSFDSRTVFPDDSHFNYGAAINGFITPLITTNYVFFLRAGSQAQLLLSTDNTTNNLAQIAADTQNGPQVFLGPESINPGPGSQCSTPQFLVAGSNYAVQAFLKSSTGPNFVQVAWRVNNDSFTNELPLNDANLADRLQPIPGAVLSTVAPSNGVVSITAQPANASVPAGARATFTVGAASAKTPLVVQWQRNGTNITGATGTSYTTGYVVPGDNAAQFRAIVSAPGAASSNSAAASLTVTADNVKPTLARVTPEDTMHSVVVQFSEPIDPATGLNPANYSIPGLTVTGASFAVDTNLVDAPSHDAVRLATSGQSDNTSYTVSVSNVRDIAANPNTILPGSAVSFQSLALAPGFAKVEYLENQTPNPGILPDLGNVNWLEANSLKFLNDDADTIVFPRSLAFSPQGNNGFRTSAGSFFGYPPLFGTRLKTFITPTNSGTFVFYISADDSATLWLSTDADPANKHMIAQQGSADAFQGDWTANAVTDPNTSSATFDTNNVSSIPGATPWPVTDVNGHSVINLVAGQHYYLEANHRESTGNSSHCAVTWDNGTGVTPGDGSPELSGSVIGWPFPAARITGLAKIGGNVSVSWNDLGALYKGFLGYPGLLAGTITSSYPSNALQSANAVTGPYTALTNSNPATFPATNSARFFRVAQ